MRARSWFRGLLLTLVLAGPCFAMGGQGKVNFDLYHGYQVMVRGSAGPLKGLTFLLDTGASPTVLDPRVAQKLHLEESPARIMVVGGSVTAMGAVVPSLRVGPVERRDLPVLIEDLSFLQKGLPFRVDGVIGLDVLGETPFLIDYTAGTIQFGSYPRLSTSLPLRMEGGLAVVMASVNGVPAKLLIDTGASSLTLFSANPPQIQRSALNLSPAKIGEFQHKQVTLRSLRIGGTEFSQPSASVVSNGSTSYPFDGLLSPAAVGITRIAIDLGRGEVAFSR